MADGSNIGWLNRPGTKPASWTPVRARNTKTGKVGWHCEKVGPECEFCYSETYNEFRGTGLPFKPGHLRNGDIEVFLDDLKKRAAEQWAVVRWWAAECRARNAAARARFTSSNVSACTEARFMLRGYVRAWSNTRVLIRKIEAAQVKSAA